MTYLSLTTGFATVDALRPRFHSYYHGHSSTTGNPILDALIFGIVLVFALGGTFLRRGGRRRRAGANPIGPYGPGAYASGPYVQDPNASYNASAYGSGTYPGGPAGPQGTPPPGTGKFGSAAADPRFNPGADPSAHLSESPPPTAPSGPPPATGYQDPEYRGPGDWDGGPLDPPENRTPPG